MEEDICTNQCSSVFENGYFAGQMDILHMMLEKLEAWIEADDRSLSSEAAMKLFYEDTAKFKNELHALKAASADTEGKQ